MVRPIGFEPITLGAEIRNSIQLSHERYYIVIIVKFIFYYMGWDTGFEPATPGTTNQCSNQLS